MEAVLFALLRSKSARRVAIVAVILAVATFLSLPTLLLQLIPSVAQVSPSLACQGAANQPVGKVVTQAKSLDADALHNAGLIIAVGQAMHVDSRGWVVALSASLQESGLHNLTYGDTMADGRMSSSRGLFQLLASTAGEAGISNEDPQADARWFYGQLNGVANWQRLTVAMAAQDVEHSQFPDGSPYAKWQGLAEQLVRDAHPGAGGTQSAALVCPGADNQVPASASGKARVALAAAVAMVGKPYCWGGGGPAGPSEGIPTNGPHPDPVTGLSPGCSQATPGFDCSGLTQYAWSKAGVTIGGDTSEQETDGTPVTRVGDLQPGDLVFPDSGHVVLYMGDNKIVEAPQDGQTVHVRSFYGMWQARRVSG